MGIQLSSGMHAPAPMPTPGSLLGAFHSSRKEAKKTPPAAQPSLPIWLALGRRHPPQPVPTVLLHHTSRRPLPAPAPYIRALQASPSSGASQVGNRGYAAAIRECDGWR